MKGRRAIGLALVGAAVAVVALLIVVLSLLRSGMQYPESESVHLIRTMASAQAAYHSVSGGSYGQPECLARPSDCIEGYDGSAFLDARMLELIDEGFLVFHGRPFKEPPADRPNALEGYALVAASSPSGDTERAFCIDETAHICVFLDGRVPEISNAQCPADCLVLK